MRHLNTAARKADAHKQRGRALLAATVAGGVVAGGSRGPSQSLPAVGPHSDLPAGVAIAIHNIPEGLATFVGALSDAKVGGSIAAAIAIHNIPGAGRPLATIRL